jgi:hypothetical protein
VEEEHPRASLQARCENRDMQELTVVAPVFATAEARSRGWERFKAVPPPVGYDPGIIPQRKAGPMSPQWGVMRLEPWRLRVFPGVFARTSGAEGEILTWRRGD